MLLGWLPLWILLFLNNFRKSQNFTWTVRRITPFYKITLPFKPSRCIKTSFYTTENTLDFFTAKGFRRQISRKLFYEYIVIFFNLSPTSNHIHPLLVENCDSNSRLVVDEDDNGKFRLESVKTYNMYSTAIPKLNNPSTRGVLRRLLRVTPCYSPGLSLG